MNNDTIIVALRISGVVAILFGVVVAVALLDQFSGPAMFGGRDSIDTRELALAIGAGSFHVFLGILSLGLASLLAEVQRVSGLVFIDMAARSNQARGAGADAGPARDAPIIRGRNQAPPPSGLNAWLPDPAPEPDDAAMTECPACGQIYPGNMPGQVCGECGTDLHPCPRTQEGE